jgi:hypothetical protein
LKPAKLLHTPQDQALNRRIDAAIDRILASEEELIPSSGFTTSVMERIEQDSAVPPPILFPWKRAIPGILLSVGVFGWGGFEFVRLGVPALSSITVALPHLTAASMRPIESAGWVAMALGVSLVSWLLSRRLAGRGGLL